MKIWEVQRSNQGAPLGVDAKKAAMLLKGHRSAVMWVAFSPDTKRVVTVSKAWPYTDPHSQLNLAIVASSNTPVTTEFIFLYEVLCSS